MQIGEQGYLANLGVVGGLQSNTSLVPQNQRGSQQRRHAHSHSPQNQIPQQQQQQQQQEDVTIPFPSSQDTPNKPVKKRGRRSFHRPSAAETYLDQQQGIFDDMDGSDGEGDGSAALNPAGFNASSQGGNSANVRGVRDAWFQPKWVPGPLFAVHDVLDAFPATAPATEQENAALVEAESDPRFDLEDLRALSYDEYVENFITSVLESDDTSKDLKEKFFAPDITEERRKELGFINENELSQTIASKASYPTGNTDHFLPFKMVALEAELAIVRVGGKEFMEGGENSPRLSLLDSEKPGKRRSRGRDTKQARSYQRITTILKDESYFGPTEPVSSTELMSAAKAKMLYQEPTRDVIADAKIVADYDAHHVPDMVPEDQNELVLRITFYSKRFAKEQEFLVLGSQPLVVLRDAIACAVDGMMAACEKQQQQQQRKTSSNVGHGDGEGDSEKNNDDASAETATSSDAVNTETTNNQDQDPSLQQGTFQSDDKPAFFKSASFLIENVFYNDMRDPHNADYSAPILDWVDERRKELHMKCSEEDSMVSGQQGVLGPYRVDDMSNVRFDQILIRIGSMYSFLHQADCEHRFMISDVRLLGQGEDHDRSNYPLLLNRTRIIRSRCDICSALVASKVTCNDAQAPCSPCHWCEHCYDSFHLRADGSPAYTEFQTLPYVYDTR